MLTWRLPVPELPEVETVRRGLEPVMTDRKILNANVRRPDLRWPFPERMAERLTGARILRLRRRAKYVLADLDRGETLLIHLGMSGRMLIQGKAPGVFHQEITPLEKHDHVVFDMEGDMRVVFNDPRRFGAMDLFSTDAEATQPLLAKLGPEPLSNAFSGLYLFDAFRHKRSPVKSALLDQRIVAGLGNIYVCEALWHAGISPKRLAGRISRPRIEALSASIRDVLEAAIRAGGSSLRDFRQADGDLGYFQHGFVAYDRENSPCSRDGCDGTISRIVQSGRSTFYCKSCQK